MMVLLPKPLIIRPMVFGVLPLLEAALPPGRSRAYGNTRKRVPSSVENFPA